MMVFVPQSNYPQEGRQLGEIVKKIGLSRSMPVILKVLMVPLFIFYCETRKSYFIINVIHIRTILMSSNWKD